MKRILVFLIAMAFVSPVLAQGPEDQTPPIAEASRNAVIAFLKLTPEQASEWDEIYWIHRDEEQPLKEAIAEVQTEIDALFEAGEPDPAEVGALVITRRALGEQLFNVHLVYHEDFVLLLDEAQARKLRFIARADDVQKFIPAFKLYELIPRR